MLTLDDLRRSPNALAPHYSRFDVGGDRILLSGHSHQAWPDVAEQGLLECFANAASAVDRKWALAEAKVEAIRHGYRRFLGDPDGEVATGPNTHDLVLKLMSCLDLRRRPRVVTTEGEFHTLRRQLDRLAEEGLEVVRVPVEPVATLAERLAAEVDDRTAMVGVSAVLFMSAWVVPDLAATAAACEQHGAELLVDAYHALGTIPFRIHELGLTSAWITSGGYKYLQLGEGNAILRLPPHGHDVRPAITGWFAVFDRLTEHRADPHHVAYGTPASRFAGGTYDPASAYRGAAVFGFFEDQGLTPELLHETYQHQLGILARAFDDLDLPRDVLDREREVPVSGLGGFLSLITPHAGEVRAVLGERGVLTDSRADRLRVGPAPYLSDDQLEAGMRTIAEVAAAVAREASIRRA